jgi:hypothetical protein
MGQRASLAKAAGWLLVLACTGSPHVRAQGRDGGSATAAVLAQEQAWSDAESRGDSRALERLFDNALVKVEDGRLVTKGECLSSVRSKSSYPRQIVAGATTVHIYGSTAVVVGTYRETGVRDGKPFQGQWRFIDTWVNKENGWILVAAGASPLSR